DRMGGALYIARRRRRRAAPVDRACLPPWQRPEVTASADPQLGFTHGAAAPGSILGAAVLPSPAAPFLVGFTAAPSSSTLISSSEVSPDFPRLTRIISVRIST